MDKQYPRIGFRKFNVREIPLKWLDGPDKLHVTFKDEKDSIISKVDECFLNINPEDFGIEIDRIAWISLDLDTILFDGENWGKSLIDSPVGLFEVEHFNNLVVQSKCRSFIPDIFFYMGQCYDKNVHENIKLKIKHYIERISKVRSYNSKKDYEKIAKANLEYDMCPATRQIVSRYLSTLGRPPKGKFDVFISFASEDERMAKCIYEYYRRNSKKKVFFSNETIHDGDYMRQIMQALESAQKLIVMGTSINHIMKSCVEFEWRAFHMLSISERKERCLVPVMIGVDPRTLPLPLRMYQGYFLKHESQLNTILPKLL